MPFWTHQNLRETNSENLDSLSENNIKERTTKFSKPFDRDVKIEFGLQPSKSREYELMKMTQGDLPFITDSLARNLLVEDDVLPNLGAFINGLIKVYYIETFAKNKDHILQLVKSGDLKGGKILKHLNKIHRDIMNDFPRFISEYLIDNKWQSIPAGTIKPDIITGVEKICILVESKLKDGQEMKEMFHVDKSVLARSRFVSMAYDRDLGFKTYSNMIPGNPRISSKKHQYVNFYNPQMVSDIASRVLAVMIAKVSEDLKESEPSLDTELAIALDHKSAEYQKMLFIDKHVIKPMLDIQYANIECMIATPKKEEEGKKEIEYKGLGSPMEESLRENGILFAGDAAVIYTTMSKLWTRKIPSISKTIYMGPRAQSSTDGVKVDMLYGETEV